MRNLKNNKEKEQTEEYQVFDEVKPAHISVPLSFSLLFKCFMLVLVLILQVFHADVASSAHDSPEALLTRNSSGPLER